MPGTEQVEIQEEFDGDQYYDNLHKSYDSDSNSIDQSKLSELEKVEEPKKPEEELESEDENEEEELPDEDKPDEEEETEDPEENTDEEEPETTEESKTDEKVTQEKTNEKQIIFDEDKLDDQIKAYSVKEDISEDEAREIIEKDLKLAQEYKCDPLKLARTIRNSQSEYSKLQSKLKETEKKTSAADVTLTDDGYRTDTGVYYPKVEMIKGYKEENPDITETLEDDQVWKLVQKEIGGRIKEEELSRKNTLIMENKQIAKELVGTIKEKDKRFVPDLEKMLTSTIHKNPTVVVDESVVSDYMFFLKGKSYEEDMKKARADAYEKGKNDKKILGEKVQSGSSKASSPKVKTTSLSAEDKKEALRRYGTDISEADAYKLYKGNMKFQKENSKEE